MPVVRVTWFEGKSHEQKEKIVADITDTLVRNTGMEQSYIYVIFEDVKPSNWAGDGKLYVAPAEEMPD